jgi:tetratricopeptide (TPR) repeat protein
VYLAARSAGLQREACRAQRCRAQIALEHGAHAHAGEFLDDALELAEATGDRALIAGCYYARARQEALAGKFHRVEDTLGEALMHARVGEARLYEAHAYSLLGHCRSCLGLLDESRQYWGAARDIYDSLGSTSHQLFSALNLSLVLFIMDEDALAQAALASGLLLSGCPNYAVDVAGCYYQLASLRAHCGRLEDARALLTRAAQCCSDVLDQQSELWRLIAWARFHAAEKNYPASLERWTSALQLAQQRQNRFAVAEIRLGRAMLHIEMGNSDTASAILQDAEMACELFRAETLLARCYCLWARWHAGNDALPAARAALGRAQAKASRMQPAGILLRHDLLEAAAAVR